LIRNTNGLIDRPMLKRVLGQRLVKHEILQVIVLITQQIGLVSFWTAAWERNLCNNFWHVVSKTREKTKVFKCEKRKVEPT